MGGGDMVWFDFCDISKASTMWGSLFHPFNNVCLSVYNTLFCWPHMHSLELALSNMTQYRDCLLFVYTFLVVKIDYQIYSK